jgi:hypothetical protein
MRRNVADIRIGSCDDVDGLVWFAGTSGAADGADAGAQVGALDEKKGREDGHKESVEEGGDVTDEQRQEVKAKLIEMGFWRADETGDPLNHPRSIYTSFVADANSRIRN